MRKKEKQKIRWQDKAAGCIAKKIISIQILISSKLQKIEQRLTAKQKKTGLFIFCLISSVYLLYLLGNALFFKQQQSYYHFFPKKERTTPLPDAGPLQDTSTKPFIHQKKHKQ